MLHKARYNFFSYLCKISAEHFSRGVFAATNNLIRFLAPRPGVAVQQAAGMAVTELFPRQAPTHRLAQSGAERGVAARWGVGQRSVDDLKPSIPTGKAQALIRWGRWHSSPGSTGICPSRAEASSMRTASADFTRTFSPRLLNFTAGPTASFLGPVAAQAPGVRPPQRKGPIGTPRFGVTAEGPEDAVEAVTARFELSGNWLLGAADKISGWASSPHPVNATWRRSSRSASQSLMID